MEAESDARELMTHMKRMALRKKIVINDLSHIIKSFQIQAVNGMNDEQKGLDGTVGPVLPGHFYKVLQD